MDLQSGSGMVLGIRSRQFTDASTHMDEEHQEKAIDSLRDWSKWLIGLNFSATTGCVIVLQQGVGPNLKPFLFIAILLFALSVLSAALVVGMLASLIQALPLRDESGSVCSIYDYRIWGWASLGILVRLQFVLFTLGVFFFLAWVAFKPAMT